MSKLRNKKYIYLNNDYIEETQATISVQERGFRFGDGVFETIRVKASAPYQWGLHIKRLQNGLDLLKIDYDNELKAICDELISKNNIIDGFLRISISRGIGSRGYLPDIQNGATLVIETIAATPAITEPIDLWLSSYKKIPDVCIPAAAKTMQGLNSTLARMEAQENNCFESLLTSIDGYICEGSSANIFWFKDNKLYTPANNILPGTIRDVVISVSPYQIVQGDFSIDELKLAEEVFITNVAWLIAPVKSLQPNGLKWHKFAVSQEIRELL